MAQDPVFTDLPNHFIAQARQICIVTRDLDARVREFADRLGIGPWWIQTYEAPDLVDTTYRGQPGHYSMRLALAWTGDLNWEIIEPVSGPSIYHEFLEEHGEGLQHVGILVEDAGGSLEAAKETFMERGFEPVMEGTWGRVRFCYVQTDQAIKTTLELIHRPTDWVRPAPERWYPPQA